MHTNRQIFRRAVIALAVVVLLPVWYIGSYATMWWMIGNGSLSWSVTSPLCKTIYEPLESYAMAGSPSSNLLAKWRTEGIVNLEVRQSADRLRNAEEAAETAAKQAARLDRQ